MCIRFAEPVSIFGKYSLDDFETKYNVSPNSNVWVIMAEEEIRPLQWGLIPSWIQDLNKTDNLINISTDTVRDQEDYMTLFKECRCLIPVSGFYLWKSDEGSSTPYFFYRQDRKDFCLAGIWDQWRMYDIISLDTFAIITTTPEESCAPVQEQMPLIIHENNYDKWLNNGDVDDLLDPPQHDFLTFHEVSNFVNDSHNEGTDCIKPV